MPPLTAQPRCAGWSHRRSDDAWSVVGGSATCRSRRSIQVVWRLAAPGLLQRLGQHVAAGKGWSIASRSVAAPVGDVGSNPATAGIIPPALLLVT